MKLSVLYFSLFSLATGLLYGSFEDNFHEKLLRLGWSRCLSELNQYPADKQRIILEKALIAFSGDIPPRLPEQEKNFKVAQSAMLAIPGHAKYYQDKIEKTRELVKENSKLPEEMPYDIRTADQKIGPGHYDQLRHDAFRILGCLPSPESVAVLGHFLEDPEGRDRKDLLGNPLDTGSDVLPMPPNCRMAYDAISHLGIENPPTGPSNRMGASYPDLEPIDAWKNWWNEVKTGKRTYRFVGSDIEYGPDGPIAGVEAQKNDKERNGEEGRIQSQGKGTTKTTPSDPDSSAKASPLAMVIAALAVMVSLIWYFGKGRSQCEK